MKRWIFHDKDTKTIMKRWSACDISLRHSILYISGSFFTKTSF